MPALKYVNEYQAIWAKADSENRDLTPKERGEVEALLDEAQSAHNLDKQIKNLDGDLGAQFSRGADSGGPGQAKDLGRQFTESAGYKAIRSASGRGQSWTSGAVELQSKTLFEGTGGGTLVPPQYVPGVVSKLFQPTGLINYFSQQLATSSHVRYVTEGTATSGATGVAEGAAKPESTLAYSEVDEPVRKIATTLPISDELLEDANSIQTYINSRLSLFLDVEMERQLLLGGGTNELVGITGRSGINTWGRGTVDNNAVAVFKAAAGSRGSAFLDPDLVVMNPANWQATRLLTDKQEQFYGGGPWAGQYGGSPEVGAGYFSSAPLWGMNVFVSNAIGAGTAVLGSLGQAAAVFNRGGPRIEASNSHEDFFKKDLHMIRAERRLALAVYRPASFVTVTGLS